MPKEAMHAMERDRAKIDEKKAEIERLEADVPFLQGEERKERVRQIAMAKAVLRQLEERCHGLLTS